MQSNRRKKATKKKATKKKATKKRQKSNDPRFSEKDKCNFLEVFSINQSLVFAIQKHTDRQTHEIMSELTSMYKNMLKDFELDLNKKSTAADYSRSFITGWARKEVIKKRTYNFPGTDIPVVCTIKLDWFPSSTVERFGYREKSVRVPKNNILAKVSLNMVNKNMIFTADEIGDVIAEGDILDCSENVDEPKIKESPTPAEIRARRLEKKKKKNKDAYSRKHKRPQ